MMICPDPGCTPVSWRTEGCQEPPSTIRKEENAKIHPVRPSGFSSPMQRAQKSPLSSHKKRAKETANQLFFHWRTEVTEQTACENQSEANTEKQSLLGTRAETLELVS